MVFVSTWLSFAFALYLINRIDGRRTYTTIPYWKRGVVVSYGPFAINWKACVLITVGFIGEEGGGGGRGRGTSSTTTPTTTITTTTTTTTTTNMTTTMATTVTTPS